MNLIDRTGLLWRGGLSVGVADQREAADRPPVAEPDIATAPAGGTVTSDVLGNDADPEGGALAVVEATADLGSVAVAPDGTLVYTAPHGYSGFARITYTVVDPAGNTSQGTVLVEVVDLAVPGAEFTVGAAPGELVTAVSAPAEAAGDYVLKTTDLAAGPVALVPPRISGTAAAGATVGAVPGLWAYDEADAPLAVTRQWLRGAEPIAEATGASYVIAAADAGQPLRLVETATNAAGSRQAASAEVAVAAGPVQGWTPAALPGLALWLDASDSITVMQSGSEVVELADKSGHGRHVRKVAGLPAPTLEGALGGKPALRFPQSAVLRTSAALPGLPGMPGLTLIAVTQAHVSTGFSKCFVIRNGQAAGGEQINLQTGYSIMWFGNGNRHWTHPAAGPVVSVAHYPENGTHGGTEWWQNGARLAPTSTSRATSSVSLPADAYVQIGSEDSPSSEQSEILLILGSLSHADRQKAEGYLAHRWDLAGQLPVDHPYLAAPPDL